MLCVAAGTIIACFRMSGSAYDMMSRISYTSEAHEDHNVHPPIFALEYIHSNSSATGGCHISYASRCDPGVTLVTGAALEIHHEVRAGCV